MDGLVGILVDMLHSALAWEQEHSVQHDSAKISPVEPLTKINILFKVGGHENVEKGDHDEHENIGLQ